jgi:imidazoleglycerol-phosphate dehydratase/histidinol-phosphatase
MKVLFIDRDGTLINEPSGGYIDSLEKLHILPFVIKSLQVFQSVGFKLIMISNQPGLGTDQLPEKSFWTPQNKLMEIFYEKKIEFEGTFFCPHFKEDNCNCMKPKTGLIDSFLKQKLFDLENSYVIGDRETDLQLGKNIGCNAIFYSERTTVKAAYNSKDWNKITTYILSKKF